MRETEYVIVAPGTENVLERVSCELIKRHTYVEALWVAEQGDKQSAGWSPMMATGRSLRSPPQALP